MLESARREWNRGPGAPVTILSDKDLQLPSRLSHARRESGKCKEWAHSVGGSDQAELPTDLPEGAKSLIQVLTGMGRGDLATDPGPTLRDHRVTEAGHEHALSQAASRSFGSRRPSHR